MKSLRTLTPEERKMKVRKQMYVELRAMEMERRQRVAQEALEKSNRERQEREEEESQRRLKEKREEDRMRQVAKKSEEEEGRSNEEKVQEKSQEDQVKKEKLHWEQVMMVECTLSALKKEQRRQKEDELSPIHLTSDVKGRPQGLKEPLRNNWVGPQKIDSVPVKEKVSPGPYHLFTAKPCTKPKEKPQTSKPKQWLRAGYWIDKYQNHTERKEEKRKLKAEEQHAKWTMFKDSRATKVVKMFGLPTSNTDFN